MSEIYVNYGEKASAENYYPEVIGIKINGVGKSETLGKLYQIESDIRQLYSEVVENFNQVEEVTQLHDFIQCYKARIEKIRTALEA